MRLSPLLTFVEAYDPKNFRGTPDKEDILRYLGRLYASYINRADGDRIAEALIEREKLVTTSVGKGIAFPNANVAEIEGIYIGVYALPENFDWQSMDKKPVWVAIPVIASKDYYGTRLNVTARLSYLLKNEKNREQLKEAINPSSGQVDRRTIESI